MEVEFVACYEASNQAIWLKNFVFKLQLVDLVERPLQLYYDKIAADLYCKSDKSSARSGTLTSSFLSLKIEFEITLYLLKILVVFLKLEIHSLKGSRLRCSWSILFIWGWLILMIF